MSTLHAICSTELFEEKLFLKKNWYRFGVIKVNKLYSFKSQAKVHLNKYEVSTKKHLKIL